MEITRYIPILGVKTEGNSIIPCWDTSLIYENHKDYGRSLENKEGRFYNLVKCIFDLKTKLISVGIEISDYPKEDELPYKKNEEVMHEVKHHLLEKVKIIDITFDEFDLTIDKGKNLYREGFEKDVLYSVKRYKPTYHLSNGKTTICEHELFKIKQ